MNVKFPDYKFSRLVFSDFHLSYQPVYPGVKDSPLQKSIDETDVLELAYDENTFSFEVSTINYDSPGNALYSWKLEGFYEKWTQPGANNLIRFTNLPPGRYILHVRAISREEHDIVFRGTCYENYHHATFLVELVGYLVLYSVGNRGIFILFYV